MRIAVSAAEDKGLDSQLSLAFGRAPYFVIVEIEDKKIKSSKTIQNTAAQQFGGAGITAAQLVANERVSVVISGAVGPRAFQVFQQLGIKPVRGIPGTVRENVEAYIEGKLQEITVPGPFGGRFGRFGGNF